MSSMTVTQKMRETWRQIASDISAMPLEQRVDALNELRSVLHEVSPFKTEPVDCVLWKKPESVVANDYNPNKVAPPEMRLLELSIKADGYTQPIVTFYREDGFNEVVDGFHRNRVGRESREVRKRLQGYLPTVAINSGRSEKTDRMAATIRHNRARGKHEVDSMSDIVVELKKRNRSDEWIAEHLGMDPDEVLRLCQVSGIAEVFADTAFSRAWDIEIFEDTIGSGTVADLVGDTTDGDEDVG